MCFGTEQNRRHDFPTVHRVGATPVPIPNTEVKTYFGDGTAHFLCGRVARRWDSFAKPDQHTLVGLFAFRVRSYPKLGSEYCRAFVADRTFIQPRPPPDGRGVFVW
jgi:hypothetical protein